MQIQPSIKKLQQFSHAIHKLEKYTCWLKVTAAIANLFYAGRSPYGNDCLEEELLYFCSMSGMERYR